MVDEQWWCSSGELEYGGVLTLGSQPLIDMVRGRGDGCLRGDWCWKWRHVGFYRCEEHEVSDEFLVSIPHLGCFQFVFITSGRDFSTMTLLRFWFFGLHTIVVDLLPTFLLIWLRLFIVFLVFCKF